MVSFEVPITKADLHTENDRFIQQRYRLTPPEIIGNFRRRFPALYVIDDKV